MEEVPKNEYSLQMNLRIRNIERKDIGGYTCTSSNALGKAEGTVRLQGKFKNSKHYCLVCFYKSHKSFVSTIGESCFPLQTCLQTHLI